MLLFCLHFPEAFLGAEVPAVIEDFEAVEAGDGSAGGGWVGGGGAEGFGVSEVLEGAFEGMNAVLPPLAVGQVFDEL